jgi:heat shock protein HslJ/uncharacterized protein YecT (DUF1311 family)
VNRIGQTVCGLLLTGSVVAAEPQSPLMACMGSSANRIEASQCLDRRLVQANADMARGFQVLRVQMLKLDTATGRPNAVAAFEASQNAFAIYREKNCAWAAVQLQPGTGSGDAARDCMIRMTRARIAELAGQPAKMGPGEVNTPAAVAGLPAGLADISWRLMSLTLASKEAAMSPDARVTIEFHAFHAGGRVNGKAPINSYNSSFRLGSGGRIEWLKPGFVTTRMAGPSAMMQLEVDYLRALVGSTQLRLEAGALTLENDDRSIVLKFAR